MPVQSALPVILALAASLAAAGAAPGVALAQASAGSPVATGAGRDGELDESARIDAYLADAAATPSARSQGRVTPAEAQAGARALPPMAPDSPWARGTTTPIDGPLPLAGVTGPAPPCDHRVHGEVGAEIGTGGEKGGYGVATMPVGKACQAQVTIGVSSYHGRGYGGGYAPLRGDRRSVTQDSLSLAFHMNADDAAERP